MKKNYIYALTTVFIWSTMASIVKMMLYDIPNLEALSISSYFAFFFLLLINVKNGAVRQMKNYSMKDYGIMAGLGFIGLFVYSALYYYGLTLLSAQEACILNYLWPIMLVIFSCIILKEKMTAMKGNAMLCSFAGIIILSLGGGSSSGGLSVPGMISCIVAAVCYGLYSVLNKKADYNQNICQMVIWLVVGVSAMILGLMTEDWVPITGNQWFGILWLGVVIDAVAYLFWTLALNDSEDSAKIANLAYLTPFLSVVMSVLLLKEEFQPQALVALIFIIGGIFLQNIFDKRKH